MKHLFTLLLTCILSYSFAQTKGDSKVIVKPSDTLNLFNRVALYLVERGYALERKDSELGYITTQPKKLTKWWPDTKITAFIKDGVITLSGFADVSGRIDITGTKSSGTFDPIVYVGKNAAMRPSWDELVTIGNRFGSLSYSK